MKTSPVRHQETWNQERGRSQNQSLGLWFVTGSIQAGNTWDHWFSSWMQFSWLVRYF